MIDLKPFEQSDDSLCGPASIKMVLQYYGIEASESEIARLCGHSYELGCNDLGMKRALEHYGMNVFIQENSTFEDIQYWMDRKVPVIVDWFSAGYTHEIGMTDPPNGHSSIVVELDDEYIYLIDPEFGGMRKMTREDFHRCWFDWRDTPIITKWQDLVLRQIMIAQPNEINRHSVR